MKFITHLLYILQGPNDKKLTEDVQKKCYDTPGPQWGQGTEDVQILERLKALRDMSPKLTSEEFRSFQAEENKSSPVTIATPVRWLDPWAYKGKNIGLKGGSPPPIFASTSKSSSFGTISPLSLDNAITICSKCVTAAKDGHKCRICKYKRCKQFNLEARDDGAYFVCHTTHKFN